MYVAWYRKKNIFVSIIIIIITTLPSITIKNSLYPYYIVSHCIVLYCIALYCAYTHIHIVEPLIFIN